jgi:uncharacterized membrane protein YkoI
MQRILLHGALLLALLCAALPANADAADHDRVRSAVEAGEIRPLQDILAAVRGRVPGRMLDARVEHNGQWIYEVIMLQDDGQVVAVTLDARTAQILRIQGGQ